jgi:hypothetical protein
METFRWHRKHYDISRLLDDIRNGVIKPALIDLSPEFVARYGQIFLVRGEAGPFAINVLHVLSKSHAMLNKPAVLLHVGDDGGLITFDEEHGTDAHWIVGDGNHRILAAGLERCGMTAYRLTREETAHYEVPEEEDPGLLL